MYIIEKIFSKECSFIWGYSFWFKFLIPFIVSGTNSLSLSFFSLFLLFDAKLSCFYLNPRRIYDIYVRSPDEFLKLFLKIKCRKIWRRMKRNIDKNSMKLFIVWNLIISEIDILMQIQIFFESDYFFRAYLIDCIKKWNITESNKYYDMIIEVLIFYEMKIKQFLCLAFII